MRSWGVVLGVLVLTLSACGSDRAVNDLQPAAEIQEPMGVYVNGPLLVAPQTEPGGAQPAALISGYLTYEGQCLLLNGYPLVWPYGSTWDEALQRVSTAHGAQVDLGLLVEGGGASLTWASADRSLFTGEAVDLIESCIGDKDAVLFFNEGAPSTSLLAPSGLTDPGEG